MRALLDSAASSLARVMAGVFFRSVEVSGAERIPRGVPLLIVANHVNSLADPLLLMAFVEGRARILAKSTLWSHPLLGPLLLFVDALPVYRRRDEGQDVRKNLSTFARCREELERGGSIALFPEGTSHNLPHRLPLKTGAARIALETAATAPSLRLVPVGLVYEAKRRFRSRVLINVGEPIDPLPESRTFPTDGRGAVQALTDRIGRGLETVTTSYESWDEARLLNLAAALFGEATLEERFTRSREFLTAYRELRGRDPARVSELVRSLEQYEGHLRELALVDDDVAASPDRGRAWLDFALNLPLGAVGALLHAVPYQVTGFVTRRFSRTPDEPATYMLMTSLLAFPLSWLCVAVLGALFAGPIQGLLLTVLFPIAGYAALRLREACRTLGRMRPTEGLARRRAALVQTIREVVGVAGLPAAGAPR